jgi:hypothetical protein
LVGFDEQAPTMALIVPAEQTKGFVALHLPAHSDACTSGGHVAEHVIAHVLTSQHEVHWFSGFVQCVGLVEQPNCDLPAMHSNRLMGHRSWPGVMWHAHDGHCTPAHVFPGGRAQLLKLQQP